MKTLFKVFTAVSFLFTSFSFTAVSSSAKGSSIRNLIKLTLTPEPYVGYEGFGDLREKLINSSNVTGNQGKYYGALLGLRALLEFNRFIFIGPDISFAPSLGYTSPNGSSPIGNSTQGLRIGGVLGLNFSSIFQNIPIRLWFGYNFLEKISDSKNLANPIDPTSNQVVYTGTSFKFGLGYNPFSVLNINVEYIIASFSTINSSTLTPGQAKDYRLPSSTYFGIDSLSNTMFVISVSAPISFQL